MHAEKKGDSLGGGLKKLPLELQKISKKRARTIIP